MKGAKAKKNWVTHQQFSLDRTATHVQYAWPSKGETGRNAIDRQQQVGDFRWYFQAFKVNRRNSSTTLQAISPKLGTGNARSSFRGLVRRSPKINGNSSFKESEVKSSSFGSDGSRFENKVKLFTVREIVPLLVRAGFPDISKLDDLEVDTD